MGDYPVPVSMGSPRFATQSVRGCGVTFVWFPPGAVLEPHVHDRPTLAVILTGGFDLVFANPVFGRTRLACPPRTIFHAAGRRKAHGSLGRHSDELALWIGVGTDAYFTDLRVTPAP